MIENSFYNTATPIVWWMKMRKKTGQNASVWLLAHGM